MIFSKEEKKNDTTLSVHRKPTLSAPETNPQRTERLSSKYDKKLCSLSVESALSLSLSLSLALHAPPLSAGFAKGTIRTQSLGTFDSARRAPDVAEAGNSYRDRNNRCGRATGGWL